VHTLPVLKRVFANSKAFGVKQRKTYKFNITLKEEIRNFGIAGGPFPNVNHPTIPVLAHSNFMSRSL
jgi:hypothetical protein